MLLHYHVTYPYSLYVYVLITAEYIGLYSLYIKIMITGKGGVPSVSSMHGFPQRIVYFRISSRETVRNGPF